MLLHIKITPDTYVIKCNVGGNKSSGYEVTANEKKNIYYFHSNPHLFLLLTTYVFGFGQLMVE